MARPRPVVHETSEYRRGVILGLTMAEIMLLIVFCFLIASAAIFRQQQQDLNNTAEQLREAAAKAKKDKQNFEYLTTKIDILLANNVDTQKPPEYWRRLVEADRTLGQIERTGLDTTELTARADDVRPVLDLLMNGESARSIEIALEKLRQLKSLGVDSLSEAELAALVDRGRAAGNSSRGEHDWPPIISLSEANGFSFEVASADVSPEFRRELEGGVADQVVSIVQQYQVNLVEVIGHTDEQPISPRASNLDADLLPTIAGKLPISALVPADNTGLGMARAVSVANVLRKDPRLKGVTILPLSAGQLVVPTDRLSDGTSPGDAKERRRIEIRARRSQSTSHETLESDQSGTTLESSSNTTSTPDASRVDRRR